MRTSSIPLALALLASAACGPDLLFERDPDITIPPRATWSWSAPDGDGLARDDGALTPPDSVARLITGAIERELVAHGHARVAPESADFVVHYHVGRRSVTDTLPWPERGARGAEARPGGTAGGSWGAFGQPEEIGGRAVTWDEGMLIIDVLPREGRRVAWRGVISGEIPAAAASRPADAIRSAVRRVLRDFP